MKIPFKITLNEFENEFKTALGFVDIDIPYLKIKPDLILAANELVKTIGQPTYDALIDNYELNKESDSDSSEPYQNEALNEAFQYTLASFAYMSFAPSNDLAHTPNGRKMRSSSDEKMPFEHMLASDNDNLKKRAYQAIDSLIKYMDNNFDDWKASEHFQKTHKLFVRTLEDFSDAYVLDSRLLLLKLVPGLNRCEKREILPRLGSELFNSIKEKILYKASGSTGDDTMTITEDEALLLSYIKEACAYYALYWALPRLQVQMFPEGILQAVRGDRQTIKGRVVPQFPVIDQSSKLFKDDADRAFLSIETQIKKMYPPAVAETTSALKKESGYNQDEKFVST